MEGSKAREQARSKLALVHTQVRELVRSKVQEQELARSKLVPEQELARSRQAQERRQALERKLVQAQGSRLELARSSSSS
ncbi:MAG: hypothetical protein AAF664_01980 [Planctomycetota bacterium]